MSVLMLANLVFNNSTGFKIAQIIIFEFYNLHLVCVLRLQQIYDTRHAVVMIHDPCL